MSHSPATPDKAGVLINGSEPKASLPSTDKLTSTFKVKTSLNEPSPASTYGDTSAGDSSPATPLDVGSHGKCKSLFTLSIPSLHLPASLRSWNFTRPCDWRSFIEAREVSFRESYP